MGSGKYFHIFVIFLLPASVLCANPFEHLPEIFEERREPFRLPLTVYPVQQWVRIYTRLDEDNYSFWGTSRIQVDILNDTHQIFLHSSGLNIDKDAVTVALINENNEKLSLSVVQVILVEEFELLIINVRELLVTGSQYLINIPFGAALKENIYGYIRRCYFDSSGDTVCFATTNFSAGMARQAFPLFDEPMFKCKFTIILAHSGEYGAISNMGLASWTGRSLTEWVAVTFEDTPRISGNQVTMMICKYKYIQVNMNQFPVTIWARDEVLKQLRIAKETIEAVFLFYIQLFKYQYPVNKLDIIAVRDYTEKSYGGFGCIMMDESLLLYNEDFHTIYDATNIAAEVSRLMASQWVANLVSITWWKEINLPYGLASYFQEFGLSEYTNSLELWSIRTTDIYRVRMTDSMVDSRALMAPVNGPIPINIFKNLNQPGAYMMITMLNMIVGNDSFLTGVRNYLNKYQYQIASLNNFLTEINSAAIEAETVSQDVDLKVIMDRWINGVGYPMVKVEIDYVKNVASLTQARFISETRISAEDRAALEQEYWIIPVMYRTSNNLRGNDYMANNYLNYDETLEIDLENFTKNTFVLVNSRALGSYRVLYPEQIWDRIIAYLQNENTFSMIDAFTRMQLVSDSLELAWPGYLPYKTPFTLLPYLAHETFEHPWSAALFSLKNVRDRLKSSQVREKFDKFVLNLLSPVNDKMEIKQVHRVPKDILKARFKLLIDEWSCFYGLEKCRDQCHILLMEWFNLLDPVTHNPIDLNIRKTCYCYGIRYGDAELWSFMLNRFLDAEDTDEQIRILTSLGCTTDTDQLRQYLNLSLNPEYIHFSWFDTIIHSISDNDQPLSFDIIIKFFKEYYEVIIAVFPPDVTRVCPYVELLGNMIERDEELVEFEEFLITEDSLGIFCQREIDAARRSAGNNISWHNLHDTEIDEFLSQL